MSRLADVTTFAKFLGGSATNVAVAAARLGRRARGHHEGRRRPVRPVRAPRARGVRRRCALGRHAPDAAHADRLLRDPPARRLPAALLPRADGAGHDDHGRRARPRRDPRGARVLDDGHRAVGGAEPRGDDRRARGARRRGRHHDPRPRPPPDVLVRRVGGAACGRARRCARDGRRGQPRRGRGGGRHARPARGVGGAAGARRARWRSSSRGPTACSRAPRTASSRCRRCALDVVNGLGAGDAFGGALVHATAGGLGRRARGAAGQRGGRVRRVAARVRGRDADDRSADAARGRWPREAHRRPGARALPRRAGGRARRQRASASSPAASGSSGTATSPGSARRCTQYGDLLPYHPARNEQAMVHIAAGYARQRNRLGTYACTTSVGPGATNMVTGAALATINRLPVLLLPGDTFADAHAAPRAAAARGAARRDGVGQRLPAPGVALLRARRAPRAARRRRRSRRCAC